MDRSIVKVAQLAEDRLDAHYYGSRFIANARRLTACGLPLQEIGKIAEKCNCGATPVDVQYGDKGQGLIRTSDVRPNQFDAQTVLRTTDLEVSRESNVAALGGDLLFTMSGTIGFAAVIPETDEVFSFSNTIARVRFAKDSPHDARFMAAFFNCDEGYRQSLRLTSGGIQGHVMPNPFKKLLVPTPHKEAQSYIGNKVGQADRLRVRARAREEAFRSAVAARYPAIFGPIQAHGRTNRASVADLDGYLNPGAFNPERVRIRRYLGENGGRRVRDLASIASPTADGYQTSAPYLGLDGIASSSCMLTLSTIEADQVSGTVRVLPEGPAIAKLRPYLNKVCYVPAELAGCFGSTELLCVRPRAGVSGWVLYGVLKLESTIRQLNPVSTGSTLPRIDRADVDDLMVPWLEEQEALGDSLATAQQAYFSGHRLTTAAKLLVEALIDGKVTEADLIAAHGDPAADRAILQRLRPSGLHVQGEPPLFPDLDALQQAIADASGA
jgi:type I restriction enzyme S subunit